MSNETSEVERQPWDKVHAAIEFIRGCWDDDGAEGESIHLICDDLERAEATIATLRAEVAERDRTIGDVRNGYLAFVVAVEAEIQQMALSSLDVDDNHANQLDISVQMLTSFCEAARAALSEPGEGGGK